MENALPQYAMSRSVSINTITTAADGCAEQQLKCLQLRAEGQETNEWWRIKHRLPRDSEKAGGKHRWDDTLFPQQKKKLFSMFSYHTHHIK